MRIRIFLFSCTVFTLLFFCFTAKAQQVIFNPVAPPEGSSWGQTINAMTQDRQGYMWLATSVGLHRYDGYHLISYTHDGSNTNTLASNQVSTLYTDKKGNIWIGTNSEGVDRLDPITGSFTHFKNDPADANSINANKIYKIIEDKEGNIWIGTNEGLNKLNPKTNNITRFENDSADKQSISAGPITALYEDREGTIWAGTARGISLDEPSSGALNRLDLKSGKFIRYQHDATNPQTLADDRITAIYEDSHGTFWVGTASHGIHTMDRSAGTFFRFPHQPAQPQDLSIPAPVNKNAIYEFITFITEDAAGALWLGTWQKGIYRYDPVTKKSQHFETDTVSGFADRSGWRAYSSREGILWISTIPGSLYRVDPLRPVIPYYSTKFPVATIYQDASGIIWLGNEEGGGLIKSDRVNKRITAFISDSLNPHTLSNRFVEYIYEDRQGTMWVGTQDGLNKFNQKTGTFTRYVHDASNNLSISKGHTHAIFEDHQGSFWIGTQDGLNLMDRQAGTFTHFINDPKDTNSLSNNSVTSIMDDRNGFLWVGTIRGLNRLDKRTGKFRHYLQGGVSVSTLLEDAAGVIWVGTAGGLYHLNKTTDHFILYTDPSAGLTATTTVSRILEDGDNNIWGSISKAIFRINSKRNEIRIYGKNNGINKKNASNSACIGVNGALFFGNETGYYSFLPNQFVRVSTPPQVVIADFRISDREVTPGRNSALREPLALAKDIHLKYFQNDFSFDFVGIHFGSPDDNRLFFMMEGLDKSWRKAGSEKMAYYYNVPPGHYVFKVKAASSEGIWAERSIMVVIGHRWWLTWWAYTVYAVLLALGIWGIFNYRSRSLRQKNRQLEEKVSKRTIELKQQKEELQTTLEDLKATQTQLIQKEKMASLGELTAGIAHEIQNPLNFINNFSDLNTEIIEEMKEELGTGNTKDAIALAENVKENNQKITYHGKRADAIVKGMLQHSRKNTGVKETTDINALTDEYLRLSYHGLRAADKTFNAVLKTDFDAHIGKLNIIPQDIGRVLLNLFNNAFYAVSEKKKQLNGAYEPTVSVTTKQLNNKIEIKVGDNGNGIPQKAMDKIFQPFFTTKPSGQGTGLGLSLSYDIVTKGHGGEMKVESVEGEGAAFIILLPA